MNNISCRAWDKRSKSMKTVLLIDWINGIVNLSDNIKGRKFNNSLDDEVVIMMGTGLYDKKCEQIFDGDIIEIDESITKDNKKHKFKVTMFYGSFCIVSNEIQGLSDALSNSINDNVMSLWELCWHNLDDMESIYFDLDFIEVIGNIYENKNLLY